MKKGAYLFLAIIAVTLSTVWYSCEEKPPEETCLADDYCEITVTVCCDDDNVCVFKYNGKEYPDTEQGMTDLLDDLNCVAVTIKTETPEQKSARSDMFKRLQDHLNRTREIVKEVVWLCFEVFMPSRIDHNEIAFFYPRLRFL